MKCALLLVMALFGLWAGVAIAQTTTETPDFIFLRQIGEPHPQGIQYEPQYDRFAWVDAQGRLLLVDAAIYAPQHTLYESGAYNAYRFRHDGR
jgi:hypothetical protein